MLTMAARKLKMEPCRVCSSAVADYRTITLMRRKIRICIVSERLDSDPQGIEKRDRIRMEVKSWIRIRTKAMRIRNPANS